jgi:hypothetical protein
MEHFGPLIFLLIILAWIWQSIRRIVPAIRESAAGTQAIQGPGQSLPRRPGPAPSPPRPAPAPPAASRPIARPAPAVTRPPRTNEGAVVGVLGNPSSLRTAVIVAEVLAPPVALRRQLHPPRSGSRE